jgi:hypothetical protein
MGSREEYMKKTIALGVVFLLFMVSFTSIPGIQIDNNIDVTSGRGDILYVGGSGEGNYTSIQSAIDDANPGDTVYVFDDSSPYYEWDILIDKSINLIGENRETTVIDGDYNGTIIIVRANNVIISDFTICNCLDSWYTYVIDAENCKNLVIKNNNIIKSEENHKWSRGGILLKECSNNMIQNNIIKDFQILTIDYDIIGINISDNCVNNNISGNDISKFTTSVELTGENSYNNIIYGNYIHDSWIGIQIENDRNKIVNNIISWNWYIGIDLKSNNNIISGNIINFTGPSHIGSYAFYLSGRNNLIFKNQIVDNTYTIGISTNLDKGNNSILYNLISRNGFGIYCDSTGDYFSYNEISNNEWGIACSGSSCVFMRNNFISNELDVDFTIYFPFIFRRNIWDKNYWNRPRFLPKIIFGEFIFVYWFFPWFQFDWHPAKEPYDINATQGCGIE